MYYRLNDDYALRSWKFVSHAMYHRYAPAPLRVDAETFELLLACDGCEWFGHCAGGCRALGILESTKKTGKMDYFGCDPLACIFYRGGWYERVQDKLGDFKKI